MTRRPRPGRRVRTAALAAIRMLLVLCPGLLCTGLAWADPAVFVARAPGVTAYLLGSVHLLRPGMEWRTPAIGRAFDEASECWFELDMPTGGNTAAVLPFMRGIDLQRRLPTLLSPRDHARLVARAQALRLPGGAGTLDAMQPWLAWMMLEGAGMLAAGMDPEQGVDHVLQDEARAEKKTVVGLETLEQQVDILATQPEDVALRALHELLAHPSGIDREVDWLVKAWLAGRIDSVGRAMSAATRREPAMFRALLTDRNAAWAGRLDALRGTGKTVLVTVGAGHLAGRGNLREQLRAHGFTVNRVWQ